MVSMEFFSKANQSTLILCVLITVHRHFLSFIKNTCKGISHVRITPSPFSAIPSSVYLSHADVFIKSDVDKLSHSPFFMHLFPVGSVGPRLHQRAPGPRTRAGVGFFGR